MKVFISNVQSYVTTIIVDGIPKRIAFEAKGKPYFHGEFITYDEKLANALTHHPQYGEVFSLQGEDKKVEEEKRTYNAVYDEVKKTQEAVQVLMDKYNLKKEGLRSKNDVLQAADELNISFPNLK